MDEQLVRSLKSIPSPKLTDCVVGETDRGTCLFSIFDILNTLNAKQTYETTNDMKNAEFNSGDICYTTGYYERNDGGGAMYAMVYEPTGIHDNGLTHALNTSSTIRAKMILQDNSVNVHQFGAFGDGIHDDYKAIQNAINTGLHVKFSSGKTYRVNKSIQINASNINVDFNNCMIVPYNCYAITIEGTENKPCYNISLNNVSIRCSNNGNGFNIGKYANNINIRNYKIFGLQNSTGVGVKVDSSTFVNFDNGIISGINYTGKGFVLKSTDATNKKRVINVRNTLVENIEDICTVQFADETTDINFENINIMNNNIDPDNLSRVFYLDGPFHHFNVKNCFVMNTNSFLYTSSDAGGTITIEDISIYNSRKIYSLNSMSGTNKVVLKGCHKYDGVPSSSKYTLLESNYSNIHCMASIDMNASVYDTTGSDAELNGMLHDYNYIDTYEEEEVDLDMSKSLDIRDIKNHRVNWCGDLVLRNITGIEGQIVKIRSSTGQEIASDGNIILYPKEPTKSFKEALKEFPYTFKCVNGKWIRID